MNKDDHLIKANHNEKFVDYFNIDHTPFLDWVITGIFYTALHYIDAYLATKGYHPPIHKTRDNSVATVVDLKPICSDYRALKTRSENARYGLVHFQAADIKTLKCSELDRIKNHISPLLT